MYAIIRSGGKQFRVGVGDVIDVDSLGDDQPQVTFEDVLLVNNGNDVLVGAPTVAHFLVKGEYLGAVLGPKVISYKYKRRKRQTRKRGHRQQYSRVKITDISARQSGNK